MASIRAKALLSIVLCIAVVEAAHFTVYSSNIPLRPGEVHNRFDDPIAMPKDIVEKFSGRNLPIYSFAVDIVTTDESTGVERQVPLTEVYNHHYVLVGAGKSSKDLHASLLQHQHHIHCGAQALRPLLEKESQVVFGGGTGGEYRHFDYTLAAPYATQIFSPEFFFFLPHYINVKGNISLLECPCTSERIINVANNSIDGHPPETFACNKDLLFEKNPSCSLATYKGGLRCCSDGVFLVEKADLSAPPLNVRAKLTIHYRDDAEIAAQTPVNTHLARCCDVTGDMFHKNSLGPGSGGGNAEYDVPQCAVGTPPEKCVHVVTNVQTLDYEKAAGYDPEEILELVSATGHLHLAGLSIDLYDHRTGQLLCHSEARSGTGTNVTIGNEANMLVQINGCKWGPPPLQAPLRFRAADLVRSVSTYNSTESHTGVMGLWLIQVAPVHGKNAGITSELHI